MTFGLRDVLEEFISAQSLGPPVRESTESGGIEAVRRAWRVRQIARGECIFCRRPARPSKRAVKAPLCHVHGAKCAKRARERKRRLREAHR